MMSAGIAMTYHGSSIPDTGGAGVGVRVVPPDSPVIRVMGEVGSLAPVSHMALVVH